MEGYGRVVVKKAPEFSLEDQDGKLVALAVSGRPEAIEHLGRPFLGRLHDGSDRPRAAELLHPVAHDGMARQKVVKGRVGGERRLTPALDGR